jgi:molybdopterin converting factor small subunit
MIEVRLFATFREGREKILYLEPEQFHVAGDVTHHLGIPDEEVAIYLINGFHSKLDAPIKDGDVLAIFPPVGGG